MKKIFQRYTALLLLATGACLLSPATARSQSVIHTSGNYCVGVQNSFVFAGSGSVTSWTITGNYTVISSSGSNITIKWNTAANVFVTANYSGFSGPASATLSNIPIGVSVTPTISISASANNVCQGTSITFTSSATNTGTSPSYFWYVNGSNISGATGPTYTTSSLTNGAQVYCIVSSSAGCVTSPGATSNTLTMTINSPGTMSVTVSGTTNVCTGSSGSYNAAVTNGPNPNTLTYTWLKNGTAVTGQPGTPAYVLSLTTINNNDVISCVVSTSATCFSPATSNNFTVSVFGPQPFTAGIGLPSGLNFCQGASVTFTANPSQAASSYQWMMNGANVSGATGSSFTTTATSLAQLQSVSVNVTAATSTCLINTTATGSNASVPFIFTPAATPTVSVSMYGSAPTCPGGTANFVAATTNQGSSPSFQWRLNGVNIPGAGNTSGYSTTSLTNGQLIDVVLTSSAACATSTTVASNVITFNIASNVGTTAAISGPAAVQQGTSSIYFATTANATGYSWSITPSSAGSIDPQGNATWYQPFFGVATVSVTANGCGTSSAASTLAVTVRAALSGGTIISPNVTAPAGSDPGPFYTSPASGGNCSGNYTYQWQQTTALNGTFQDIPGQTGPTYDPGNVSVNTWYQRKAICGSDAAYSNPVSFTVGTVNTVNLNYIRTRTITRPGITDIPTAALLTDPFDLKQTTEYIDGLGRSIQSVDRQASPLGKDEVTTTQYDQFDNQPNSFLPYISPTSDGNYKSVPINEEINFNTTQFPGEQYYYAKTVYEASPLNREMASYPAGIRWVGNGTGVARQYMTNTASDNVQIWNIAAAPGSIPTSAGAYPAGQLYKTGTTDENGNQVLEYKDKEGRLVLKKVQAIPSPGVAHTGWLCTYYVYDVLSDLRFVIQPQAVTLIDGVWTISQSIADELCFRNEYDTRNRISIKKLPGTTESWMVYDARDRLVMSQDGNQRGIGKWLVTQFDVLDETVGTGLLTDANNQSYHQNLASTSQSYPSTATNFEQLTQVYYNDYGQISAAAPAIGSSMTTTNATSPSYFITGYNTYPVYSVPVTASSATRGMVTGKMTKVIGGTGTQYLYAASFYDDRGRTIQTKRINITGGLDILTTQYGFNGKPLRTLLNHQKNGSGTNTTQTHSVLTKMSYDAMGHPATIYKNIDGAASDQLISTTQYNELGQLRNKILGNTLDNLVYDYNIRGWVTGINKNYVGGTPGNYFGMELGYDNPVSVAGSLANYAHPNFSGNIAGTIWKTAGAGVNRKYDFSYDNANRLKGADFNQQFTSAWAKTDPGNANFSIDFSVSNLGYDANGNILSMTQNGFKPGQPVTAIDQLTYAYTNLTTGAITNKLQKVTDAANDNTTTLGDFHYDPATKTATDYSYDGNGNMVTDNNKKISGITYNYLNLPQQVTMTGKGTINYIYDANGVKLSKTTLDNPASLATTTLYLDGFVYQQQDPITNPGGGLDVLQCMTHEEGRARWTYHTYFSGTTGYQWDYDFFEKDHLGNTRVLLSQEKDTAKYLATMETAYRTTENALFYNIAASSFARASAPGYPVDLTVTNPNDNVAKVNGSVQKVGPAIILKVMSGDKVDIGVNYYYNSSGAMNGQSVAVTDIINSLATGIVSAVGPSHGSVATLTGGSSPLQGALTSYLAGNNPTTTGKPNAYLNWILLDDQFNYVSSYPQSGAMQVGASGTAAGGVLQTPLGYAGIPITKSGYLYIYVSNATPGWDVFFDNLSVKTYAGPMLEENHYYPFGLTMAGISDKALKTNYAENKYRFNKGSELQNKEFSDGSGLELYDAVHRLYDPQIGRFGQIDKLADMSEDKSPYTFASDDPISRNDPFGLQDSVPPLQTVTVIGQKNKPSTMFQYYIPNPNDMKLAIDNVRIAPPAVLLPSPNTLLGKISILEHSKRVAENGEKVADAAKAIASILKSLLQKGKLGGLELSMLEEYAGRGGDIAAAAQAVIDLYQGLSGEISADECETSLAKLGFIYGLGFIGDALGGPVVGFLVSAAAEKFLDAMDKLNKESYELQLQNSGPPGSENNDIGTDPAWHR